MKIIARNNLQDQDVYLKLIVTPSLISVEIFRELLRDSITNEWGTRGVYAGESLPLPAHMILTGESLSTAENDLSGRAFMRPGLSAEWNLTDALQHPHWGDFSFWTIGFADRGMRLAAPRNVYAETLPARQPLAQWFATNRQTSVLSVFVPFAATDFSDAIICSSTTKLIGNETASSVIADTGFSAHAQSKVNIELVADSEPINDRRRIEVQMRDENGALIQHPAVVNLDVRAGFVTRPVVQLVNGVGQFFVTPGAQETWVKVGFPYWAGLAEYRAPN